MQTGGEALERYAQGRASEAVRELEAAAPRIAHRVEAGEVRDLPAGSIRPGDIVLLRPGELLACDSVVLQGNSHVDTSRLTGEPMPVSAQPGVALLSGSLNLESPLTLRATSPASESQYARIVELVRTAQESKTPLQRLADRYAIWFTPLTLAVCAAAYLYSGDPARALAVLVVATPCPLILATPVAVVGGINRAARRGIIFRHGTALEQLGRISVAVFDKTGTLTIGRPRLERVVAIYPWTETELLRLAGSIEQGSGHLLARTVVQEAVSQGVGLLEARSVTEAPGQGVTGEVAGRTVTIGGWSFLVSRHPAAEQPLRELLNHSPGAELRAYVAVDGLGAGLIEFADRLRPELVGFIPKLRDLGIKRVILLSGDDQPNAAKIANAVQIEEAHGDLLPEQKVAYVQATDEGREPGSDGGRRHQRCTGPQHRYGRRGAGLRRGRNQRRSRGCSDSSRRSQPAGRGDPHQPTHPEHRPAEHLDRARSKRGSDGRGQSGLHPAGRWSAASGGNRCGGNTECTPGGPTSSTPGSGRSLSPEPSLTSIAAFDQHGDPIFTAAR